MIPSEPSRNALGAESMAAFQLMRLVGILQAYGALPVCFGVNPKQPVNVLLRRIPGPLNKGNAILALQVHV